MTALAMVRSRWKETHLGSIVGIGRLADTMTRQCGDDIGPMPFFLGPGCAEAANVPPLTEVVERGLTAASCTAPFVGDPPQAASVTAAAMAAALRAVAATVGFVMHRRYAASAPSVPPASSHRYARPGTDLVRPFRSHRA